MRNPQYRIVVADARTKRDGRAIEEIGKYHPKEEPSLIEVDSERAQYWLGVGAQPTEAVAAILRVTGDWQKFKGLPGAEGTLRVAEPKADKKAVVRGRRQGELRRRAGPGDDPAEEGRQGSRGTRRRGSPRHPPPRLDPAETVEVAETAEVPPRPLRARGRRSSCSRGRRGRRAESPSTPRRAPSAG